MLIVPISSTRNCWILGRSGLRRIHIQEPRQDDDQHVLDATACRLAGNGGRSADNWSRLLHVQPVRAAQEARRVENDNRINGMQNENREEIPRNYSNLEIRFPFQI